jgi:xanthine dehydrogenase YagS FAD-binding subunit
MREQGVTPFQLIDARSAAHAVALLAQFGPVARPIGAGGDLLDLLKEGVEGALRPGHAVLVNLATAGDLAAVSRQDSMLRLGAMATLADLAANPDLQATVPMMIEAISRIASPQLRNVTTLVGNLLQRPRCLHFRHPLIDCFKKGGTGCPAASVILPARPCRAVHPSDLAPVLLALDATLEIIGPAGSRTIRMEDLYAGAERNPRGEARLAGDEIVTAVHLPVGTSRRQAFEKATVRGANEFAIASVAVTLDIRDDVVHDSRIVLGGVALRPMRCIDSEKLVVGRSRQKIALAAVAEAAVPPNAPTHQATVARTLVCRALASVLGRSDKDRPCR